MKHWTLEEIAAGIELPIDIVGVVGTVFDIFGQHGADAPRLLRIGQHDSDEDCHRFEALIELAPGILLPVEHGLLESLLEGWEQEGDEDLAHFIDEIVEGVDACMPMLANLANALHDARLRARRVIADWNAAGIPTRLIEVRLAPYDHWRRDTVPTMLVLVETLSDSMEPKALEVPVEKDADLENEMGTWREDVAAGYARRTSLTSKGASGTIDQIAINALAHFGDLEQGIRRLGTERRFWLPDDTAIVTMNGHVYAGNGRPDDRIEWTGSYISVPSTYLPAEQLRQSVGRPVSQLIEHEFLSDDIIVVEASCSLSNGQPVLTIKVDMPRRLFCSVSGRVWADVEGDPAGHLADQPAGDTVIPFRARQS